MGMQMRRRLATVIVMCLLLSFMGESMVYATATGEGTTTQTSTISEGNSSVFPVSGTCGENLTWTIDEEGVLTISGSGDMTDYGQYAEDFAPWYVYRLKITGLVLEEGITSIGEFAFDGLSYVTNATVPEGVLDLGRYSFFACMNMKNISLPTSLTSIGESSFEFCLCLQSVEIPEGITIIENATFSDCYSLSEIIKSCIEKVSTC